MSRFFIEDENGHTAGRWSPLDSMRAAIAKMGRLTRRPVPIDSRARQRYLKDAGAESIYYISDIHIDHKLAGKFLRRPNAERFIERLVTCTVEDVSRSDRDSLLIVLGDVSCDSGTSPRRLRWLAKPDF